MVNIPLEIQKMIREQQVIVVGSVDINGVCNVSPRSAYICTDDAIYWLDYFSHKSRRNFSEIPWISVAVFDKERLKGFQLKGKVSFVTTNDEKQRITDLVIRTCSNNVCKIYQELSSEHLEVMMFKPKAIYSLNPQEEAGTALVLNNDGETVSLLGI